MPQPEDVTVRVGLDNRALDSLIAVASGLDELLALVPEWQTVERDRLQARLIEHLETLWGCVRIDVDRGPVDPGEPRIPGEHP